MDNDELMTPTKLGVKIAVRCRADAHKLADEIERLKRPLLKSDRDRLSHLLYEVIKNLTYAAAALEFQEQREADRREEPLPTPPVQH